MLSRTQEVLRYLFVSLLIYASVTVLENTTVGILANEITRYLDSNLQTGDTTYIILVLAVVALVMAILGVLVRFLIDSPESLKFDSFLKSVAVLSLIAGVAALLCEVMDVGSLQEIPVEQYGLLAVGAAITYRDWPQGKLLDYYQLSSWIDEQLGRNGTVSLGEVERKAAIDAGTLLFFKETRAQKKLEAYRRYFFWYAFRHKSTVKMRDKKIHRGSS